MAHTPRPWAVQNEQWIVATRGVHDGEIIVAPTYWMESPEAKAEAAANARLIAAAPDLLAALKDILEIFEDQEDIKDGGWAGQLPNDAMRARMIVRAAIAKAEPS